MWIRSSGQISEVVYHIATPVSSHLVFAGENIALVDSGVSGASDILVGELDTLLGEGRQLDYILLTHLHPDHVGGIAKLRARYPEVKVVGSPLAVDMLQDENRLRQIYDRNTTIAKAMNESLDFTLEQFLSVLRIDLIAGDGDSVDLGDGIDVKVIGCPGHSPEHNAYYVPFDSALAPGEALGCYGGRDKHWCSCRADYEDYVESIDKLASLEIRLVGLSHAGVLSGQLAQRFVLESRGCAEKFFSAIKERLSNGELIDEIVATMLPEWQAELVYPEGPFVVEQEVSLRDMVSVVARF